MRSTLCKQSEHLFPSSVAHAAVCRQAVAPLEPLHGGSGGGTVFAVILQSLAQRIKFLLHQPHRPAGCAAAQHDAGVGHVQAVLCGVAGVEHVPGVGTQRAVQEFQLKNKMNMDGKVGQNTWNVLYTRYTAKHGLHVPYPGIALRSGSSGGTVRLVQQKLNSLGERLTADGRFGASTAAAVQRFQRRNGLTADGAVGKETWEKMF